jgi:hypothetical protein
MLIELPAVNDKRITKLVKKLNSNYEKKKWAKFQGSLDELVKWIESSPDDSNLSLYILSILAEELPEYLNDKMLVVVKPFLTEGTSKEKLNSIIIVGSYIINSLEDKDNSDPEIDTKLIFEFMDILQDSETDERVNVFYFLDQFPDNLKNLFLLKQSIFVELLKLEKNPEILNSTGKILKKIQPLMSLSLLIDYIQQLKMIYRDIKVPMVSDIILDLLEIEIPLLNKRTKEKWNKKKVIENINNRLPMRRIYNLKKMAKNEDMDVEDVEENILSQSNDEIAYIFSYSQKSNKFIIEFEKELLLVHFNKTKYSVSNLIETFNQYGITNQSILTLLIKGLVKKHLLKGYLTKKYYYPYSYLRIELVQTLNKKGVINIDQYTSYLSQDFVNLLLDDITEQSTYEGVYDSSKENYFTFKFITTEIEQTISRSNVIDLSHYEENYEHEDFLRIEEYSRQHFFSKFHKKHIWLTNLGTTRIQTYVRTSEQIGFFNLTKSVEKLSIPEKIISAVIKEMFTRKNGFWNSDGTIFYFGNYVKAKINKIQKEQDAKTRELMIEDLAKDLQIDKDEIAGKVNEKLHKIGKILADKDEAEINPLLRDLQMNYNEFIEFVESLEKPYLVIHSKIIFSEKKIEEALGKVKNSIITESKKRNILQMQDVAARSKCSKKIVYDLIHGLIKEEEIKGLWLNDNRFITEYGIQRRIDESKNYVDIYTLIAEKSVDEEEVKYLEEVLFSMMEAGTIKGVYHGKVFQSDDIAVESSLQEEIERFTLEITPYMEEVEIAYELLKEIFINQDITPRQIDEYEKILEEIIRKILSAEPFLKRIINNANKRLKNQLREAEPYPKKRSKKSRKGKGKSEEPEFELPNIADGEIIKGLMDDFNNWKSLIFAVEQKAGQIVFLKKKLKSNPDHEESQKNLKEIYEYIGFTE